MLQYLLEVVLWTVILYAFLEIIKIFIYKFVISPENIKKFEYINKEKYIKSKTKSEN